MAIIVETGTGTNPDANSYIDTDYLEAYALDRGYEIQSEPSNLIYAAMDWLENRQYQGWIKEENQPLLWPRHNVWYRDYQLSADEIPALVKKAQAALCLEIDRGYNPLSVIPQGVKREKVGEIEVEYQDGTSTFAIRSVNQILRPLLAGGINSAMRVL
jgi:hypothetical protein